MNERQQIMARLDILLAMHSSTRLAVADVCKRLGLADRTFRALCRDMLGMSPQRYMQLYRLRLVRTALLRGDEPETTVTTVALAHGFLELGRFAGAYRAEFGEPPSATLRAARARADSAPVSPYSLTSGLVTSHTHADAA